VENRKFTSIEEFEKTTFPYYYERKEAIKKKWNIRELPPVFLGYENNIK